MTKQEIKQQVVDKLIDGIKVSFDTTLSDNERVCIFASSIYNENIMKQQAVVDEMVKILTDNNYSITLNEIEVEQIRGNKVGRYSVILRENNNETN